MFKAHVSPSKPSAHTHEKLATPSTHSPPFSHGASAQSSLFKAHVSPSKPSAHTHEKLATPSTHSPSF